MGETCPTGDGFRAFGYRVKDRIETDNNGFETMAASRGNDKRARIKSKGMTRSDKPAPSHVVKAAQRMQHILNSRR